MSAVLRGRSLPLEQSLGILAQALKKQFPTHMVQMPGLGGPAHNVIIPAFLRNEVKLYTIDLAMTPDRLKYCFRYTRHETASPANAKPRTPRLCIGGSGGFYLNRNEKWVRPLLSVVRAYDRGQATHSVVADHLATLNHEVHLHLSDKTVGPRCIVAWRNSKEGAHQGGGGHRFYNRTTQETSSVLLPLPAIANGTDARALVGAMIPHMTKLVEAMRAGEPAKELDKDKINAELARLPNTPDETFR